MSRVRIWDHYGDRVVEPHLGGPQGTRQVKVVNGASTVPGCGFRSHSTTELLLFK